VRSERVAEPRGLVGDGHAPRLVTAREAAKVEREKDASGSGRPWRSTVIVRRRGEVAGLPVRLRLSFEGGGHEDVALGDAPGQPWTGRWKKIERTGARRLVSATVDPDGTLVLDVNRLDDGRRASPDGRAAAAWGTRFIFWLQQALALVGM
jgi:hypothetical protein